MATDKRITMKKDRALVRYVKVKKTRDAKMEKEFLTLLETQKTEIDKNIQLRADVRNGEEAMDVLKRIAHELTIRKQKNQNQITDAKDKLAVEEQKFTGAKTEKERLISRSRSEVFARAQAKNEIESEEIERLIVDTNKTIDGASALLESKRIKLKESEDRAKDLLKKQNEIQEAGKKLADDDFADITQLMEATRIKEKYKTILPVSQNDDEYVFMLVQPDEYEGDLAVTVTPVNP